MKYTFTKADLTKEFLEQVVLIEIFPSSGQFGVGYVRLITADSREYLAHFNDLGLREFELDKLHPMFRREEAYDGTRRRYAAEADGWRYIEREKILVRNTFLSAFSRAYREEINRFVNAVRCEDIAGIARRALGFE